MAIDIKGKIHKLFDTVQVSPKFTKREFVLEIEDGKYPQLVLFQATGDRIGLLDGVNAGDEVRAVFNLRGREWKKPDGGEVKYFNSLEIWKLERTSSAQTSSNRGGAHEPPPAADGDDIPF